MIKRAVLLALVWIALTDAAADGLAVGAVTTLAGVWLSLKLLPIRDRQVSLVRLAGLVPGFLRRSLLGGVDVAWRALHPRLPLDPGWHVVPTALPEGGPRVTLGGEFSLLPGTLVAGTRGDELFVHCLDRAQPIAPQIKSDEVRLAATLGKTPP